MRTHVALVLALVLSASTVAVAGQDSKDLLEPKQVEQLVETAHTAADHQKLSRHYAALAAKYDADAARHKKLAARYRKSPTASETKRPGAPDTAAHCDRFARLAGDAAKEAAAMAAAHERMASER
jgi:hypothetical protein